ncbi:MAG: 3-methyl-2-oxobutanoate hydroxymethyltransferase, partial [Actinobacteria bacterium]|nr:3-methyl-2-oxobutanoate hydroxymethyltransferase [Actinomycetota bacterium]
ESAVEVIKDARAVRDAGAAMLLLEAVTPEVGGFIAKDLDIPVYSIGAGPLCDGQLLIVSDVLGIWEAFKPKFVRRYAEVADISVKAIGQYVDDVRAGRFPEDVHFYKMIEGESEKLDKLAKKLD